MYTLTQALEAVGTANQFDLTRKDKLIRSTTLILANIPQVVLHNPAFCIALRGRGRYISINMMNYLLFRTPAYQDGGGPPVYDCHMIFEQNSPLIHTLSQQQEHITFQFQDFACINLGLWYDELLDLSMNHWKEFQDACIMAMTTKRTRTWQSNIQLTTP